jgi:hypothetical protein
MTPVTLDVDAKVGLASRLVKRDLLPVQLHETAGAPHPVRRQVADSDDRRRILCRRIATCDLSHARRSLAMDGAGGPDCNRNGPFVRLGLKLRLSQVYKSFSRLKAERSRNDGAVLAELLVGKCQNGKYSLTLPGRSEAV